VDVIEGAAVKKAYQKALLCLHPDKLQQRGAAMHHKYIAEKVFDILQVWRAYHKQISDVLRSWIVDDNLVEVYSTDNGNYVGMLPPGSIC
jgi:hypothetical protein